MKQYNVTGMSCAACQARVEKAVQAVPGVTACAVSLLTNSMGVEGTAPPEAIVEAVRESGAQLVCLSALLTTTMAGQKDVVDALVAAGLRDQVKVMVGGAPVTQEFADEIGADVYTLDAASAAAVAYDLLTK